MNIFILNTGRCGSTTFIKACKHILNFTSAHESRTGLLGDNRFDYPKNHIEADNRLSWFMGRLERHYGNDAIYVHLLRNNNDTASSFTTRFHRSGIYTAYKESILMGLPDGNDPMSISLDYCDTVNSNIELFLRDKSKKMDFCLENAKQDFRKFWDFIGAKGYIDAAISEFNTLYNASKLVDDLWLNRVLLAKQDIQSLIPLGNKYILVNEDKWDDNELVFKHSIPFLEKDGQYWGPPPDDSTAIRELERLHQSGAKFIVFGEPSFWWLEHYKEWHQYLCTNFPCILKNDRLLIFKLCKQHVDLNWK